LLVSPAPSEPEGEIRSSLPALKITLQPSSDQNRL
jgi:hypothetical protein